MDMDLNTISSDIVGFDSTWDVKQVLVKDSSTDNLGQESGECKQEQFTNTAETSEKEVRSLN